MKKRSILTVIPARGGSKGIPRKNLYRINRFPLIYYAIKAAKTAKEIDRFIVSTEDEEIAEIAKSFGAEVPFLRPPEFSNDDVILAYVMRHVLEHFDERGEHYDAILSLQATTPLIKPSTIGQVINKFHETGCLAVVTVSRIRHGHPYLSKRIGGREKDEIEDFVDVPENADLYPRQKREDAYYCNGAIFLRDRCLLQEMDLRSNCLGHRPKAVVMAAEESVNIDDTFDVKLAELLLLEESKQDRMTV